MALFSMKLENLQQLFVKELRDLYDAETQITDALPKMIDAANHPALKHALQEHLSVTNQQITRLDRIFQQLGEKPPAETISSPSLSTPFMPLQVTGPSALTPSCWASSRWRACCSKPWTKRRKPTRNCRKSPTPSTWKQKPRSDSK